VKAALRSRRFANPLNLNTAQVFTIISTVLAGGAIDDPSVHEVIGAAVTGAAALVSKRGIAPNIGPLAMFYQEAFRTLR
jgi:hypothetical protein